MDREEILEAIQRTARENDGTPLGVDRFAQLTGIKPYDWGKFWARFGDAQREAGFAPNQKTMAYEETELMQPLIALITELGHFPTRGEMRLKRFRDQGLPPDTVYYRRYGGKDHVIKAVYSYAKGHPEHKDVVILLEPSMKTTDSTPTSDRDETIVRSGYVYLFKERPGHYKIGVSDDPERRLYELTKGPYRPELVHKIQTDDPVGVEAYWHKRFADKMMRGEWFRLHGEDVSAFKSWRKIF